MESSDPRRKCRAFLKMYRDLDPDRVSGGTPRKPMGSKMQTAMKQRLETLAPCPHSITPITWEVRLWEGLEGERVQTPNVSRASITRIPQPEAITPKIAFGELLKVRLTRNPE
jgi:hypothetical protein